MDGISSWESNGCTLGNVQPGYHSQRAILVTNRNQKWHGLGQRIDGNLFSGTSYSGKLFVKLLEDAAEEKNVELTVAITRKSDNSKTYETVGGVSLITADAWQQLKFSISPASVIPDGEVSDFVFKFYTQCSDVSLSYYADHMYIADRKTLIVK